MKTRNPMTLVMALCLFALVFSPAGVLHAQGDDASDLKKRISELENRIKDLETLLEKCVAKKDLGTAAGEGWQNKKNWRTLERGMSEARVKSILGEPTKVIMGTKTLWYYPNFYGGYVAFDKEGGLAGWSEP